MSKKSVEINPLYAVAMQKEEKEKKFISPYKCDLCSDTGLERVEDGVRTCICRKSNDQTKLIDRARLPKRYEKCHFTSYEAANESQQAAFGYAWQLVKDYPAVERGLLLMGNVGVGKTHLGVSILKGLTERGFSCLFYEFGALLKEIQDSYNPISKTSEFSVLIPVLNAEVLVLDEIGAAKPTDWARDTMAHIINTRYNNNRLTIFTTNYCDNPKDANEETLEDRIGTRIRSRLYEMCKTIMITGEDYRRTFDSQR
ncbi:MAG: ATP-binding protein [Pyrinomonadaceae bacterium]